MKIDSRLVLSRRSERGATDILGKNGEYLEGVDNFICVCRGDRGDPCGTPSPGETQISLIVVILRFL
jgi:hypothetical protein